MSEPAKIRNVTVAGHRGTGKTRRGAHTAQMKWIFPPPRTRMMTWPAVSVKRRTVGTCVLRRRPPVWPHAEGMQAAQDNFWVDYEWISPSRFGEFGRPLYKPEFWDKVRDLDQWTKSSIRS
jgi:hypothetical protein